MESHNEKSLTRHEFDEWAIATKETLNSIDDTLTDHTKLLTSHGRQLVTIEKTLDNHTTILAEIAGTLRDIRTELKSVTGLYRRLDRRDEVFAGKLGVDLSKVDAGM